MTVNKGMNKLILRGQTIVNAFTSFCGNCIVLFINSKAEKQAALKRGAFLARNIATHAPVIPSKTAIKTTAHSLFLFYVN